MVGEWWWGLIGTHRGAKRKRKHTIGQVGREERSVFDGDPVPSRRLRLQPTHPRWNGPCTTHVHGYHLLLCLWVGG